MFAKFFTRKSPVVSTVRVGRVYKLDGVYVVVMSLADGIATIRHEDDRTNSTYEVCAAWLA